ncbi:MAG: DUF1015 domain-containing protein [Spirochaetaceae bacterium]|nr:DUF1015 domain-containing protein [Spirochaetaceae bacterium]
MNDINGRLLAMGLKIPDLLLPRHGIDLSAWAVIACDQFTQDRPYWEQVKKTVGEKPSTLNLIFPEVYLEHPPAGPAGGPRERIAAIHRTMESYLGGNVFAPPLRGCMYIERDTPWRRRRRGLVIALDLERYDWRPQAKALIRATEGTVPERLPPRMDVRRGAPLESPHILVLIDDEGDTLLPALGARLNRAEPAYRGDLMLGSGTITGWPLDREDQWALMAEGFEELSRRAGGRYGESGGGNSPFLYAVGDGNHSLAAAKGIWEEYKAAHRGERNLMEHPSRFALVEIENLYDPAISFEPIHRLMFNADVEKLLRALAPLPGLRVRPLEGDAAKLRELVGDRSAPQTRLGLVTDSRLLLLETEAPGLAAAALQPLLDDFLIPSAGAAIDYIHGEDALFRLAAAPNLPAGEGRSLGILLPPIRKEGLFETIARSGPLPRKSFSMGESKEKRFYLECRVIK